jgi:hypothetical protein
MSNQHGQVLDVTKMIVTLAKMKGKEMDYLMIFGCLFYLQGFHLQMFGTPAFVEKIIRDKGTIYIDHPFFSENNDIQILDNLDNFNNDLITLGDCVLNFIFDHSGKELVKIISLHCISIPRNTEIPHSSIQKYFNKYDLSWIQKKMNQNTVYVPFHDFILKSS